MKWSGRSMWPTSIDDGILHELSDIRNPSGKVISTSLLDLSKIGDRFRDRVVLVGGWGVYLWLIKHGLKAIPSIDIDLLARKVDFSDLDSFLTKEMGYKSAGYRYTKAIADEQIHAVKDRINIDLLFDRKPSKLCFSTPYAKIIFQNRYYQQDILKVEKNKIRVNVAYPEAILVLKFDIYSGEDADEREKQWKDMVDIYSLIMSMKELRKDIFRKLYSAKRYSVNGVVRFFQKKSNAQLKDVIHLITEYVGLPYDEREFLLRLKSINRYH